MLAKLFQHCSLTVVVGVVFGSFSPVSAQTADVYAVDAKNGKVYRVDFAGASATVVNSDASYHSESGGGKLEGILVRADGNLVVCDSKHGELLFYDLSTVPAAGQVITTMIARPEGVSAAGNGDLYLVSKKEVSEQGPEVWMVPAGGALPGDYGTPVLIDANVPGEEIEDTRLVPLTTGGVVAGDLLVVSEHPAALWRYPGAAACPGGNCTTGVNRFKLVATTSFPSIPYPFTEWEPNSLAFAIDGDNQLIGLIGTEQGRILRLNLSASPPAFLTSHSGAELVDKLKIAVGPQRNEDTGRSENRAFVSSKKRPSVIRYLVEPDATLTLQAEVRKTNDPDIENPTGVSLASAGAALTPAGTGVKINPSQSTEITLEEVTTPGFTNVRTIYLEDTSACGPTAAARSLFALLTANSFNPATLLPGQTDRMIPGYICPFLRDDPATPATEADPTFLLNIVDTTAGLARTQEHHIDENSVGYETFCEPTSTQPRTFYATDDNDPPIVEGVHFTDISSGCASNIGRGGETSFFLTGEDTRSQLVIAKDKLNRLKTALSSSTPSSAGGLALCISNARPNKTLSTLKNLVSGALKALSRRHPDYDAALQKIQAFIDTVEDPARAADFGVGGCTRNVRGELAARGESAHFMTCEAGGGTPAQCNRTLVP